MLDEDPEEALEAAEQGAVHHVGLVFLAILAGVGHGEALGLVEVELDRAELPRPPQRVADLQVDLRSVEGAAALVARVGQPLGLEGALERGGRLLPACRQTDALFGARGQEGGDLGEAEAAQDAEREGERAADLGLDLLRGAEDVGVVLREAAHAQQAVAHALLLEAVDGAQLGPAQRQVAVRPAAALVDLDVEGAVHRLDEVLLRVGGGVPLLLGHGHRRVHALAVEAEMPRGLPERGAADVRGEDHLVAGAEMLAAPVVLDRHADARAFRMPERQPRPDRLADAVEVQLAAHLAVVAAPGLLLARERRVELGLRRGRHPVETLQHRVLLVAAVVGAGHGDELHGADRARARDMRAAAEVGEGSAAVERDRLSGGNVRESLELVALVGEELRRLPARHLESLEGQIVRDQPEHLGLDRREVLGRDPVIEVDIVVEALLRGGPDVKLHVGIQATKRGRHDMGGAVTKRFYRLHKVDSGCFNSVRVGAAPGSVKPIGEADCGRRVARGMRGMRGMRAIQLC